MTREGVIEDKIADLRAKGLAGIFVVAEVLSGEDAAG
jgi:hypothetical protein